jgi:hypothetical protein
MICQTCEGDSAEPGRTLLDVEVFLTSFVFIKDVCALWEVFVVIYAATIVQYPVYCYSTVNRILCNSQTDVKARRCDFSTDNGRKRVVCIYKRRGICHRFWMFGLTWPLHAFTSKGALAGVHPISDLRDSP